jgi:hypothetical protein
MPWYKIKNKNTSGSIWGYYIDKAINIKQQDSNEPNLRDSTTDDLYWYNVCLAYSLTD